MDTKLPDSLPHDIEDILNVFIMKIDFRKPLLLSAAIIVVMLLIYLFYRWLKRRKKRNKKISLEEKLNALTMQNPAEFYSQLTALALIFFERRDQTRYRHFSAEELSQLTLSNPSDQTLFQDFLQRSFRQRFQNSASVTQPESMEKDRVLILRIISDQKASGRYAE